jgi:hypothetical protein
LLLRPVIVQKKTHGTCMFTLLTKRISGSIWMLESFHRLPITENTVVRGDALAVEQNLRGYAATHLTCALIWQKTLGMPVILASFDGQLIEAAMEVQMAYLPT